MIERSDRGLAGFSRRGGWLAGLFAAAIVVGLLAAWLARGDFKGRYAIPELGADRKPAAAQPLPAATARIVAPAPAAPATSLRAVPTPPPLAERDAPPPENAPDDSGRMARAIDKAARKALARGEPVHWHKAGESGYVVVSDMRDYGDRACRNVSATIDSDDGPTESSSHLWCTTPDGDWAPAE